MSSSPLLLHFPQWEGSGNNNMIYHGSQSVLHFVLNDPGLSANAFCAIDVRPQQRVVASADGSDDDDDHMIRNYSTLGLYAQQTVKLLSSNAPRRVFTLGGDCGIELAPVSYLNALYGHEMAVLWIDAHADVNTPTTSPSKTFHGMVLRALLEGSDNHQFSPGTVGVRDSLEDFVATTVSRPLQSDQVFLIGVRSLDPPERTYVMSEGITVIDCHELEQMRGKRLACLLKDKNITKVYVHIDADVLSPDEFGAVMCPTPNGIRMQTLRDILVDIKEADMEVVGGSLVEVTKTDEDDCYGTPYREMAQIFMSLWL